MLYKKSPQAWAHVHNIIDITVDKGGVTKAFTHA